MELDCVTQQAVDGVEMAEQADAFDAIFQHFHPRLVRFLSKMLAGTSVDPDDVAQESMVKAWSKRDQYDQRYRFSTWVYTIARRTAAEHLQKRARDVCSDNLDNVPQSTGERPPFSPEQEILSSEAEENIWVIAERVLTSCQYSALWLRYGEEMTVKEVAKSPARTSVSTRVLLHRARTSLQPHLAAGQQTSTSGGERKR